MPPGSSAIQARLTEIKSCTGAAPMINRNYLPMMRVGWTSVPAALTAAPSKRTPVEHPFC
jgi:hypothetical protein